MKIMTGNCCARKPELVLKFKNSLKNEMHSVRKLERAESLDTLFSLLERRNLLSMVKINLLVLFDEYLEDVDYSKNLGKYRATLEENFAVIRRFYLEDLRYRDRRTLLEKEIEQAKLDNPIENPTSQERIPVSSDPTKSHDNSIGNSFTKHRQAIFSLLSKEIGRNWSTFGRLMQLSDSSLEEIEFRHPRNVKAIVGDILETAEREQNENGQDHFVGVLMEALVEFRRKDLKNKIEKLMK